ncbi:transcriptional repressor general negative regulator of transcription subunit 4 [Taxawa tesnikishii (nom. ined.)]|nr:transcriptional repressor general negative regulator of transcription subunit 4 [Dothideales sp. JES 119]
MNCFCIWEPAPVTVAPKQQPTPRPAQPEEPASAPTPPVEEVTRPEKPQTPPTVPKTVKRETTAAFYGLLKSFATAEFNFTFHPNGLSEEELAIMQNLPLLFDPQGGAKRRARKEREEDDRRRLQEAEAQLALQAVPSVEGEDDPETGGSLQLGGEPEERQEQATSQHAIQPPSQQQALGNLGNEPGSDLSNLNINGRGLTPAQQQQLLLQSFRSPSVQGSSYLNQQTQAASHPSHLQQQQQSQQSNPPDTLVTFHDTHSPTTLPLPRPTSSPWPTPNS